MQGEGLDPWLPARVSLGNGLIAQLCTKGTAVTVKGADALRAFTTVQDQIISVMWCLQLIHSYLNFKVSL